MTKIIETHNLGFKYKSEPIFSNISFEINKGDFVAIIGANGAGKSTLIRLLIGDLEPSSGYIKKYGSLNEKKNHISYIKQSGFQAYANFPATVEEIVMSNLFSQIGLFKFPKRFHVEQVQKALSLVDMEQYAKCLFRELSGGQQQRVMLARVLVNEPEFMILDEPTTGVDFSTVQKLYELLEKLNTEKNLTILMVTHDISRASKYVTRILCLEEGSLVEIPHEQILAELSHKHTHPIGNKEVVDGNFSI